LFRSYFSPLLKSKYLSYELFGFAYDYLYQVVLVLRALSRQSKLFLATLFDEMRDVLPCKGVCVIRIQPNLKFVVSKQFQKVEDAVRTRQLVAYSQLQRIDDFRSMFRLQLGIIISEYRRAQDYLDKGQVSALTDIMRNPDSAYDSVTFTVDTDHNPKSDAGDSDIAALLESLCEITAQLQIYSKELRFSRINGPFVD